jgi:hypothetical protein
MQTGLAIAALGAAVYLLPYAARLYAMIAVAVSGLQVAMALGVASFHVKGISLGVVLGAALVAAGALCFGKSSAKLRIAMATIIAFVGAIQLLDAAGVF